MAHIVEDRVKDTTTTTGTGNLTVSGSSPSTYRTLGSVCANNDTFPYAVVHQAANEWEVGLGTYVSATPAIARTTVLASSNAGAAVNFSAGTKEVFITNAADLSVMLNNQSVIILPGVTVASVAAPAADTLALFTRKVAGRMTLKYTGPSGVDQVVQDKISENGQVIYLPNNGTTVGLNLGLAWTTGGTVSHPTPSSTAPAVYSQQKRTRWANVVTTTNQLLGLRTATAEKRFWRGNAAGLGGFNFHCRFAIGLWPAATVRLFVGLSSLNTAVSAADGATGHVCGFQHDTAEAASVLNFITRNNTTTTKVAITLAANLAAGQCFDCWIWSAPNGSVIGYKLVELNTGTTLADTTTSTTIPSNTTFLGPEMSMSNGTANITVTTTAFEVMAMSCQSDQ